MCQELTYPHWRDTPRESLAALSRTGLRSEPERSYTFSRFVTTVILPMRYPRVSTFASASQHGNPTMGGRFRVKMNSSSRRVGLSSSLLTRSASRRWLSVSFSLPRWQRKLLSYAPVLYNAPESLHASQNYRREVQDLPSVFQGFVRHYQIEPNKDLRPFDPGFRPEVIVELHCSATELDGLIAVEESEFQRPGPHIAARARAEDGLAR